MSAGGSAGVHDHQFVESEVHPSIPRGGHAVAAADDEEAPAGHIGDQPRRVVHVVDVGARMADPFARSIHHAPSAGRARPPRAASTRACATRSIDRAGMRVNCRRAPAVSERPRSAAPRPRSRAAAPAAGRHIGRSVATRRTVTGCSRRSGRMRGVARLRRRSHCRSSGPAVRTPHALSNASKRASCAVEAGRRGPSAR